MKVCPKCGAQLDDNVAFCVNCGTALNAQPAPEAPAAPAAPEAPAAPAVPVAPVAPQPIPAAPVFDPTDHTAEFDPKDISDNKVVAMIVYLMGPIGIIIAALLSKESPYVGFHVRNELKISVCCILVALVMSLLIWTIIVPIVAGIALLVLVVIDIICFFQVCKGQAKEPAIIKNLKFLK